jgi:hypothetical protein
MAHLSFLLSGLLAVLFVGGWVDGILRDGLSDTDYMLSHWPAVIITVSLPVLATVFLCVGLSLLHGRDSA